MRNLSVLFLIIIALATGCKKQEMGYNVDTAIDVWVMNEEGVNLISNTIDPSLAKTFHLINGEFVEYHEPNLDAPRGLLFLDGEGENKDKGKYVSLFPSHEFVDNKSTTVIDWGVESLSNDTIVAQFVTSPTSIVSTQVWLNGEKVWDVKENEGSRSITIIK